MNIEIIPAILTDDPAVAAQRMESVAGKVDWVQVDIMDGNFVQTVSFSIGQMPKPPAGLSIELHLMVGNPVEYFDACDQAGAGRVYIHVEATDDLDGTIEAAGKYGFELGVALNPESQPKKFKTALDEVTRVLVMGVHPGKSGQGFIPETVDKVKEIKKMYPNLVIAVDGGVGEENIKMLAEAGVSAFSIGSGIFGSDDSNNDPKEAVNKFKSAIT